MDDDLRFSALFTSIRVTVSDEDIMNDANLLAEWAKAADADIEQQREAKYPLLMEWFGVAPDAGNAWEMLARRLALKHYAGFREELSQAGKKNNNEQWDDYTLALLWFEVQEAMQTVCGDNVSAACRILASQPRWLSFLRVEKQRQNNEQIRKNKANRLSKVYSKEAASSHIVLKFHQRIMEKSMDEAQQMLERKNMTLALREFLAALNPIWRDEVLPTELGRSEFCQNT